MSFKLSYITLFLIIVLAGCSTSYTEKAREAKRNRPGNIATYTIVRYSGGRIMDVWNLAGMKTHWGFITTDYDMSTNSVRSLIFHTEEGTICISGDYKIIANPTQRYNEYHAEFETQTYEEKYKIKKDVR